MAYTPATVLPSLKHAQIVSPTNPNPRLAAQFLSTDTSLTLNAAIKDHLGAVLTGNFIMGIRRATDGYTTSVKVPAGSSVDGITFTGLVRIRPDGLDATTADDVIAAQSHSQDDTVFISVNPVEMNIIVGALTGTVPLNGTTPPLYDAEPAAHTERKQLAEVGFVQDTAIAGGVDASATVKGISKLSVAPASATIPIAVGDNDGRVPTQDENNALVGTSGAPSTSNKYVTDADTATAATASKVARRLASGDITVTTTPTNATDAASKAYADTKDLSVMSGATTLTNATGTQNIAHGGASTPKYIRLTTIGGGAANSGYSTAVGTYNGTTTSGIYAITSGSSGWAFASGNSTSNILTINDGNNNANTLTSTVTFDGTNIILATTRGGAGATVQLLWEAFFQD